MTFFAFGLNHVTAPVALREAFALDEAAKRAVYRSVPLSDEAELLLLSTCNRTEVYLYGSRRDVAAVQAALAAQAGTTWPADRSFLFEDEEAIRHLLEVTAGLRSLVPGDAQILAQVKDAYRIAAGEDHLGTVLHRLVHTAFRTAKRVINETAQAGGTASVAAAAVARAQRHFEATARGLAGCRVLLVGAGQMARLALEALRAQAPAHLTLTNRTQDRAEALARTCAAQVAAWPDRHAAAAEADLVVVASGADEPVLRAAHLPPRRPGQAPALVIDIAVPRNVEHAVDALPGYTVIDLDRLDEDLPGSPSQRLGDGAAARQLCEEALGEYVAWVFHRQALQPAIDAIREMFESIRLQEIERHHHRFSDLDRAELDRLTTSIVQKILAVPVVRLKSVDPDSIDFVRGIQLLHALFTRPTCEDTPVTTPPEGHPTRATLPSEAPALCPFEPEDAAAPPDPEAQLREALRLPRQGKR